MVEHFVSFSDFMIRRRQVLVFRRAIALGFMRLGEAMEIDEEISWIDACLMFEHGR